MKPDEIISTVETTLLDPSNTYWSTEELLSYINDAQRQVVNFKPEANAVVKTVQLDEGTRQTLPQQASVLIDVTRNDSGEAITAVDRRDLDRMVPDWPTKSHGDKVEHYMYDDRAPGTFMVYPPVAGGTKVEVIYSATLKDLVGTQDEMDLGVQYRSAVIEYVLYRAHSKDSTAAVAQQAQAHYQLFLNILKGGEQALDQQAAGKLDPQAPQELK